MDTQLNILLVEDHQMMTAGIKSVLETQPDLKVIATAANVDEALRHCQDLVHLDLIIMDIYLSKTGPSGLELTRKIKTKFPMIKILVFSTYGQAACVERAKHVGADGFISKNDPAEEIIKAIRVIGKGDDIWSPEWVAKLPIEVPSTKTELKILKYIARELTTAKIGIELAMLETTVSAHRHNIIQKHNIKTQGELFNLANDRMLLYGTPPDPIFSVELKNFEVKAREKSINVEFKSNTDGFTNPITQALLRIMEEAWNNMRSWRSTKNVFIELNQDVSTIKFTIRYEGRDAGTFTKTEVKGSNSTLERILAAIGGKLLPTDGSSIVAVLPVRKQYYKHSADWHRPYA